MFFLVGGHGATQGWEATAPTQGTAEPPKSFEEPTSPLQGILIPLEHMSTYGVSTKRAHALLANMRAEMNVTEGP